MKQIAEQVGRWSYYLCEGVFIDTNVSYRWVERLRVRGPRKEFCCTGKIRYIHQLQHLLRIAGVEQVITM